MFQSWTGVGFSVVIYVEWFKTEVNRLGKRGGGGALVRMPGSFLEFVTPHSFRPRPRLQFQRNTVMAAAAEHTSPRGFSPLSTL